MTIGVVCDFFDMDVPVKTKPYLPLEKEEPKRFKYHENSDTPAVTLGRDIWKLILRLRFEMMEKEARPNWIAKHKKQLHYFFELKNATVNIRNYLDDKWNYNMWNNNAGKDIEKLSYFSQPQWSNSYGLVYDWSLIDRITPKNWWTSEDMTPSQRYDSIEKQMNWVPHWWSVEEQNEWEKKSWKEKGDPAPRWKRPNGVPLSRPLP